MSMIDEQETESVTPSPLSPAKLSALQLDIAQYIPLIVQGRQVTIDEAVLEGVLELDSNYAQNPLSPEQFDELKEKLKAQFNAMARPLSFDAAELENEAPVTQRTLVMASPEKLADTYKLEIKTRIFEDWFCVRHALVTAGAHIEIVPPTLKDGGFREVYTRDRYIIVGDTAYLPDPSIITAKNFPTSSQESIRDYPKEIVQIEKTLQNMGVKTVTVKDAWFEGGNVVRHYRTNTLFFGIDFRTKEEDGQKLLDAINATQPEKWTVEPVKLTNMPTMYHLDTGMSEELPHGEVMISPLVTDSATYEKIRAIVGWKNVIPLSNDEALGMATNTIDVGETLLMTKNFPALRGVLIECGYKVIMPSDYGMESFEFGEGGVHCMTNDIRQVTQPRKPQQPSL
jgi:N-dimethylarginine dimethylaminohydrolase